MKMSKRSPKLSKSTSYMVKFSMGNHWMQHLQDSVLGRKNVRTMAEIQVERSACMEGSEVEIGNHQRPTSANKAC